MLRIATDIKTQQGFDAAHKLCVQSGQLVLAHNREGRPRGYFIPPDGRYEEPAQKELRAAISQRMAAKFLDVGCPPYTKQRGRIGYSFLRAARLWSKAQERIEKGSPENWR